VNLILIGLNHRTAPVDVRERYALSEDRAFTLNEKLVLHASLVEGVVISTCNRTEIIAVADGAEKGEEALFQTFDALVPGNRAAREHFYVHRNRAAVEHLFRVAASLDSMVLGETQILGQVKRAYALAAQAGSCGAILNRLFHRAFRAAKRVRAETGLGATSISLARVGVQLAAEIFETLADKRLALVGAGEIAEASLHAFHESGLRSIVVLNRTPEAAARLAAPYDAQAASLSRLDSELAAADIVVSSVTVDRPVISTGQIQRTIAQRHQRSLLIIDLGLPRNVDPACKQIDDAYLYDVDDLEEVAQRGRDRRREAMVPAEAILALELEQFERWQAGLRAVPTIRNLVARTREIARREAQRTLVRMPDTSDETRDALERMADAIVAKLLHRPLDQLRNEAADQGPAYYAEAIREIFGLEEDEE